MNAHHSFVTNALKNAPKKVSAHFNPSSYLGTDHPFLGITNPVKHHIARDFKKAFPHITQKEMIELIDSCITGKTFEEKTMGPMVLLRYPKLAREIRPEHISRWLRHLTGWCEIDTLCQSTFPPETFLADFNVWKNALSSWSQSLCISHRRASLVLLCKATGKNPDPRLRDLAFANIEKLMEEKNILITKAVSWLLRSMTIHHAKAVEQFMKKYEATLPKIALRETRNKLRTGKK